MSAHTKLNGHRLETDENHWLLMLHAPGSDVLPLQTAMFTEEGACLAERGRRSPHGCRPLEDTPPPAESYRESGPSRESMEGCQDSSRSSYPISGGEVVPEGVGSLPPPASYRENGPISGRQEYAEGYYDSSREGNYSDRVSRLITGREDVPEGLGSLPPPASYRENGPISGRHEYAEGYYDSAREGNYSGRASRPIRGREVVLEGLGYPRDPEYTQTPITGPSTPRSRGPKEERRVRFE